MTIELGTDILNEDQKTKKHETYNLILSLNTQPMRRKNQTATSKTDDLLGREVLPHHCGRYFANAKAALYDAEVTAFTSFIFMND